MRRRNTLFLLLAIGLGCTTLAGPERPDSVGHKSTEPRVPSRGLWISRQELQSLPMSGPAWEKLLQTALAPADSPNVADQNQRNDVQVMAKALVYARTRDERFRTEVVDNLRRVQGTESGARTLAVGFALPAYVIAADLVELSPADDALFRAWLRRCLEQPFEGEILLGTFMRRPNNWGTHAGAAFLAASLYLGDWINLSRAVIVFRGWLGDRNSYAGFQFGDLAWQADPAHPVPINPSGSMRDGYPIDGVLPDDQRRSGGFAWPPPQENYCYTALQGAFVQAELLSRAGFPTVWEWENYALLRASAWLRFAAAYPPVSDDTWLDPLIDHSYRTHFWDGSVTRPGKGVGWTDWTHGSGRVRPHHNAPDPNRFSP